MTHRDKNTPPVIVGLGGGMGGESHSLVALRVALGAAEQAGAKIDLISLQTTRLPLFEPDKALTEYPLEVKDFVERLAKADGYLWASPAYHGTVSGVVKNALDYTEFLSNHKPPYLDGKPVGLISTAGGVMACVTTVQTFIHIAHALRAWVVPLSVPIPHASQAIDDQGNIKDPSLQDRLRLLGTEVVRFVMGK